MIEILPIKGEELSLFRKKNLLNEDIQVLQATENDESLGWIGVSVKNDTLIIDAMQSHHKWLSDGLIRSALSYGDNRGLLIAETKIKEYKSDFLAIGFDEDDDTLKISISKVVHYTKKG